MDNVVAMVLAGGRVGELSVLTLRRAKAAVPFAGTYRIIDFPLSNLMHSGIRRVGILSQYRPSSLIDHVGVGDSWDLAGRNRGVRILPPFQGSEETDWYKGTADALWQNLDFIETREPDYMLILSGDHVYSMDYAPIIEEHKKSGAGMTMVVKTVPREEAHRFGIAEVDESGLVTRYQEKPTNPQSLLASLTIYVFDRKLLVEELKHNAKYGKTFQIYNEIIPGLVERRMVRAHVFDGYWAYARTLTGYHQAHMDLLGDGPKMDLNRWRVRSNLEQDTPPSRGNKTRLYYRGDLPPARMDGGQLADSFISEGCVVGGQIERSVLSPGVRVAPGAVVRNSILMHRVHVEEGAVLDGVIADKDVNFGAGCHVGVGPTPGEPNRQSPSLLDSGLVVIGKGTSLPTECQVGRNVILYPELSVDDFPTLHVEAGTTLEPKKVGSEAGKGFGNE